MGMNDDLNELRKENEYLADAISRLEQRMPSDEDLMFLHQKRIEADRVAWMWSTLRKHAPWVITVAGLIGTGVAWLANNSINVTHKP